MKKFFLSVFPGISFLLLTTGFAADAQETTRCKIAYSYDAAGNRIRREYRCDVPPDPRTETEQPDGTLITGVDPNPSQGPVVGYFSKPVSSGTIELYDMNGVCLNRFDIGGNATYFRIDLSAYVPGTYLITLRLGSVVETYPIVRM